MKSPLKPNERYLQIAFNHSMQEVYQVIRYIPRDPRILIEAGTPFLKREGINGIRYIRRNWRGLIVADLKVTDGADEEVMFAASAGANAATVMGSAPIATIDLFNQKCKQFKIISMVDMLGVINPLKRLLPLQHKPDVVVIHKGRDEEVHSARSIIRYKDINKIRSKFESMISVAGGLEPDNIRSAYFNGANIAIMNIVKQHEGTSGIQLRSNISQILSQMLQQVGK